MARTHGLASCSERITSHERSLLPSSTKMTSYEKRFSAITRSIHASNSGNDSSSLYSGTTIEMFGLFSNIVLLFLFGLRGRRAVLSVVRTGERVAVAFDEQRYDQAEQSAVNNHRTHAAEHDEERVPHHSRRDRTGRLDRFLVPSVFHVGRDRQVHLLPEKFRVDPFFQCGRHEFVGVIAQHELAQKPFSGLHPDEMPGVQRLLQHPAGNEGDTQIVIHTGQDGVRCIERQGLQRVIEIQRQLVFKKGTAA